MREITFEQVRQGLCHWHEIAKSIEKTDFLFKHYFRFEIDSQWFNEMESDQYLKVYFGYKQKEINKTQMIEEIVKNLFVVIIPDSLDKQEHYQGDKLPKQVLSFSAVYCPSIGSNEISKEEALQRINNWNDHDKRNHTISQLESAPLLFQIPTANVRSDSKMNHLYLGLVDSFKQAQNNDFQFDLIVEQVKEQKSENRSFYDTARPVPPFKPTIMDNGLYKYLELERY